MINITQEEIMKNWGVYNTTPLVTIRCLTYNHQDFISQALDGFLMQKTTFPFEVVIHDDASTDKTADIIREYEQKYPKIIKPIYETENQYSKHDGSLRRIMNSACKGKYFAFCEGDDYWINADKLQIQIDFLEKNPEYGMCYTKSQIYNQKKRSIIGYLGSGKTEFKDILLGYDIPTATIVLRKSVFQEYSAFKETYGKKWIVGDYTISLWFSKNSKIKFFPIETSAYRVLEKSACHFKSLDSEEQFKMSIYNNIQTFFLNQYIENKDERLQLNNILLNEVYKSLCMKGIKLSEYNKCKNYASKIKIKTLRDLMLKLIYSNSIIFKIISNII